MRSLVLLITLVLCFTGEETWDIINGGEGDSIPLHAWHKSPPINEEAEAELVKRWTAVRGIRETVTTAIESLCADKTVGSSLQAKVEITAPETTADYLNALGEELRSVLLMSGVKAKAGSELAVTARTSDGKKYECRWHYTHDIGTVAGHGTICKYCTENVDDRDEERHYA